MVVHIAVAVAVAGEGGGGARNDVGVEGVRRAGRSCMAVWRWREGPILRVLSEGGVW